MGARIKYLSDMLKYKKMNRRESLNLHIRNLFPVLYDYKKSAGSVDDHYFFMDIYVAKKILKEAPERHYDVGSRVDGFISHLLCGGQRTTMIDIRPLDIEIENLDYIQADATNMNGIGKNSLKSLSSLHAAEHFGLGRYGDDVDPEACFMFMKSLQSVLAPGGKLYFAVPVSNKERVCFNAHRIFEPKTIIEEFDECECEEICVIKDFSYHIIDNVTEEILSNYDFGNYTCGIFTFVKRKA